MSLRLRATSLISPPERVCSRKWLPQNVVMPVGTETASQPFSLDEFPHGDGPLDAIDNPSVRWIILQWGTRLGKTTLSLSCMGKQAATDPKNMMFAGPTKEAAGRVVESRLYPLLESTEGVRKQLLPPSRRSKFFVKLWLCRIFVGWAGSDTSLADVGAAFGVGNEIDKWTTNASDEADPLGLFINRFKGFVSHKGILESTPTIKGHSRIEKKRLESKNHRRYVPCPHCGHFQILRKGDEQTPGGFRWEKLPSGQSDAELAFRTAYYECESCRGKIENHHRTAMLRKGVWVPDGCSIDKTGMITGTAKNESSDMWGFGPLPSWYALTETWGHFARLWIRAQKRPRDLQDVVNSYMAETWEVKKSLSTPERVAQRIAGKHQKRMVPIGGHYLTVTVDRQKADGGFCVWVVLAHGAGERVWEIDRGMSVTLEEIWEPVMRASYQHEDGGQPLTPVVIGIDSGWNTKNTYDFCNNHEGTVALKGASTDLRGKPYDLVELTGGLNVEEGQLLLHVGTDFWETDLQSRLDDLLPGEPGSLTLSMEAAGDLEFLAQLCNGTLGESTDNRGETKLLWVKKDENLANDFRDAVRYGLCVGRAWLEQNEGKLPPRTQNTRPAKAVVYGGDLRPDGRGWHD